MPRDLAYEATLPVEAQRAIADLYKARAHAPGQVRWGDLYSSLGTEYEATLAELRQSTQEHLRRAKLVRAQTRQEQRQRAWDKQAIELDPDSPMGKQTRGLSDNDLVWVCHGTSSKFWPAIRRAGLVPTDPQDETARRRGLSRRTWKGPTASTPGFVYLTVACDQGGRGDARFYAQVAASTWGGEPVLLRLIVPWGWLEPDDDDADIDTGRVQFRTTEHIPPSAIKEKDGRRVTL
jgi:hypothetical protein